MTAFVDLVLPAYASLSFGTDLNSLASGSTKLSTGVIDNNNSGNNRYRVIVIKVALGSFTPVYPGMLEGWLVPELDGAYQSLSALTTTPIGGSCNPYAFCQLDASAATKIGGLQFEGGVLPINYKLLLRNSSGATFNASGNTVSWTGTLRETR